MVLINSWSFSHTHTFSLSLPCSISLSLSLVLFLLPSLVVGFVLCHARALSQTPRDLSVVLPGVTRGRSCFFWKVPLCDVCVCACVCVVCPETKENECTCPGDLSDDGPPRLRGNSGARRGLGLLHRKVPCHCLFLK